MNMRRSEQIFKKGLPARDLGSPKPGGIRGFGIGAFQNGVAPRSLSRFNAFELLKDKMDQDASATEGQLAQIKAAFPAQGDSAPPVYIPDHQLVRCIGRGSYGEVWLARNIMGVYRAVKIIYRKSFDSDRPFERELSGIRRFEPISRSHKGFIAVLHVGINEEQGYFFYLMELGDDRASGQTVDPDTYVPRTLAKEISVRGKLPVKDVLK